MIDWLTFTAPCEHEGRIQGGRVLSLSADGVIEWESAKFLPVVGSHDSRIMVRSHANEVGMIEVSGNPSKFLQGHNVFGCDDVPALVVAMLGRISVMLGLSPSDINRRAWARGAVHLTRVDVTESFALGNRQRVRTALKALADGSHLTHRGRASMVKEGTVYWGKNSRRWALKAYCKGDELEVSKHQLPEGVAMSPVSAFADDLLRVELVLRSMELKDAGLDTAASWGNIDPKQVYSRYLSGLNISENAMLNAETLKDLSPRLQLAYNSWREGHDLRQMLPRKTFYRYRQQLLSHGVDLAILRPRTNRADNVIPLRVVLNAVPVGVPAWAKGTPLYFDPEVQAA